MTALPYGSADRQVPLYVDPWMLSSQSRYPDHAWEFMKFLVSADVQQKWMELTGAPPTRQSLYEEWDQQIPGMSPAALREVHEGVFEQGHESPSHKLVRYEYLNTVITNALQPLFNNKATAAEVLPGINVEVEAALHEIEVGYNR